MKEYRFNDTLSMVWAIEDFVKDMEKEHLSEISELEDKVEELEAEIEGME
jgi:phosphate uptake regulator